MTLETWLIILEIIPLVKYQLKKSLNALNEIKDAEIRKYKKCTPKQKELLNLFNSLLDTIFTDEALKSKSQKDKTLMSLKDEKEKENEKEKEKQNKLLNNDNNANAKNKKTRTNTKEEQIIKKKDENKNILLEYMGNVDDKFKKYSNDKNFNSFINEFDCATNEEGKEKGVKELKDINILVNHFIERDENSEYRYKLIDIANVIATAILSLLVL